MASPTPDTIPAPPGVVGTPSGPMPYLTTNVTMDYPRLVYSAPRFEIVAIADIIEPSVLEAVQGMLPTLVPPYVNSAANAAVQALAVQLVGSTMTGPLMLSPAIPTQPTMAATKQYVDTQVSTVVPEVPPVPANQAWARETGQWIPLGAGGTVTNIATGAGLTGGPITATGTISMANMAANSLKGNNTAAVASPVDLNVGQVMGMLGAAPLNSPVFTGTPVLPTGTTGVTQPGATNNTTIATTAFAMPRTGGQFNPGGVLVGTAGAVPGTGALTLNANTVAGPAALGALHVIGANSAQASATFDAFANIGTLTFRASQGTAAAQTATGANDFLSSITAQGYTTGGAYAGGTAIVSQAHESANYSPTAQGSQLLLQTIPTGSTTLTNSLTLQGTAVGLASGGSLVWVNQAGGYIAAAADLSYVAPQTNGRHLFYTQQPGSYLAAYFDAVGDITISGATATKPGSTSWVNPSAREIKQDIQPYTGSLGDLLDLTPVTYRYSDDSGYDTSETHVGLVHDETAHMPELHRTATIGAVGEEREVDALDCGALTFALINAVKELSSRLSAIEGRA